MLVLYNRWEAFFGSAMDAGDDMSDSASMYSVDRSIRSSHTAKSAYRRQTMGPCRSAAPSVDGSVRSKKVAQHRPVSGLKPKVRRPTTEAHRRNSPVKATNISHEANICIYFVTQHTHGDMVKP